MARRTSAVAYRQIMNSGLLSRRRSEVYATLYEHGPLTVMETCHKLGMPDAQTTISPRMAELKRLGVVCEDGTKICSITGKRAIQWDVTEALPAKPAKTETTKQRLERLEAERKLLVEVVKQARPVADGNADLRLAIAAVDQLWVQG